MINSWSMSRSWAGAGARINRTSSGEGQGVGHFLFAWVEVLRWQRLPEMEKLGAFLVKHLEGIAAYCFHPVRLGVVESVNTTIKGVLRRARGMRDEQMLLLKLKMGDGPPHSVRAGSRSIPGPSARVLKSVKTVKNSAKNVAQYASVCLSEVFENGMMMKQCFATPNSPRRR
jgi:Transposase